MFEVDIKPRAKGKSKLLPVKVDAQKNVIPKGDSRKPRYWRVNLGKRFTGTSKQRRFFDTEAEAVEFIRQVEGATRERGKSAFDISQALAVEAITLSKQLAKHGVSLTDAVKFFLRAGPINSKKSLSELIPEYLETKTEGSYRYAQGIALGVLAKDFGTKPITNISAPTLSKWFKEKKWKPLNERNYKRDFAMFFRWAVRKDYITGNPFDKIDRPRVKLQMPAIFSVEEATTVLRVAYSNPVLDLLSMYAIGFFAGVRIEEIERMRWEMIDWHEGEIRLPGTITKTGAPRNIDILPALRAALESTALPNGEIVSAVNLRLRREKLLKMSGVANKRNGLRHSFATYHAAEHQDPGKLQMLLGQQTPSVLFKHYITAVRKVDASRYFSLVPPYTAQKEVEVASHPS